MKLRPEKGTKQQSFNSCRNNLVKIQRNVETEKKTFLVCANQGILIDTVLKLKNIFLTEMLNLVSVELQNLE